MSSSDLWDHYTLTIKVDRLAGGIPNKDKLLQAWLDRNDAPAEARDDQTSALERQDEEETHSCVFYRDEEGKPCYESRCLKAAIKEGGNVLKGILGQKNFRAKLAERVFVGPRLVRIDTPIVWEERPIHVMTMQGPRTSLKRQEVTSDVTLTFSVKVLRDGVVKEDDLREILTYLQDGGIGSDRSQGSGTYTLVEFKEQKAKKA